VDFSPKIGENHPMPAPKPLKNPEIRPFGGRQSHLPRSLRIPDLAPLYHEAAHLQRALELEFGLSPRVPGGMRVHELLERALASNRKTRRVLGAAARIVAEASEEEEAKPLRRQQATEVQHAEPAPRRPAPMAPTEKASAANDPPVDVPLIG
jgi:hypothetical protein